MTVTYSSKTILLKLFISKGMQGKTFEHAVALFQLVVDNLSVILYFQDLTQKTAKVVHQTSVFQQTSQSILPG